MSNDFDFPRIPVLSDRRPSSYIAFVDLLGIRELARSHPDQYKQTIFKFQREIVSLKDKGWKDAEVYGFSDSLYCGFTRFEALAEYLARLRGRLMANTPEPIFFRAAVARGRLNATSPKTEAYIFGFGEEAARIFGLQEECKGIGIRLDPALAKDKETEKAAFRNFYLPQGGGGGPIFFHDLPLTEDDCTDAIFDAVIKAFFRSKVRSKKFGRYYLPLVANFIERIDFSRLHLPLQADHAAMKWTPARVVELFTQGTWDRLFGDVVGSDNIYFLLYRKIHEATGKQSAAKNQELCESVRAHILSQKRLRNELAGVSELLLPSDSKNALVHDLERIAFAPRAAKAKR